MTVVDNTPINVKKNVLMENVEATYMWDNTMKRTRTMKNHGRLGSMCQTP